MRSLALLCDGYFDRLVEINLFPCNEMATSGVAKANLSQRKIIGTANEFIIHLFDRIRCISVKKEFANLINAEEESSELKKFALPLCVKEED